MKLDQESGNSFRRQVYRLTSQIPKRRVSTYGAIARALGRPAASRAVGRILHVNPTPIRVPCHRVVHADGRLGGYGGSGGTSKKVELLNKEGVLLLEGRVKDFQKKYFDGFKIQN